MFPLASSAFERHKSNKKFIVRSAYHIAVVHMDSEKEVVSWLHALSTSGMKEIARDKKTRDAMCKLLKQQEKMSSGKVVPESAASPSFTRSPQPQSPKLHLGSDSFGSDAMQSNPLSPRRLIKSTHEHVRSTSRVSVHLPLAALLRLAVLHAASPCARSHLASSSHYADVVRSRESVRESRKSAMPTQQLRANESEHERGRVSSQASSPSTIATATKPSAGDASQPTSACEGAQTRNTTPESSPGAGRMEELLKWVLFNVRNDDLCT